MRQLQIIYGPSNTTITFQVPASRWTHRTRTIGGTAVADSGLPATFVRRRDRLCLIRQPILEAEREAVEAWLDYVRNDTPFVLRFSANDAATAHTVYLDAPRIGAEDVELTPHDYLGAYWLEFTVRTVDGSRFRTPFLDAVP